MRRGWTRRIFVAAALLLTSGLAVAQLPPQGLGAPAPAAPASGGDPSNDFERMLQRLNAEEKASQAELDATGKELDLTHRRMLARGRTYYRFVRAGLLPIGGGFDSLVDHAARVERTRQALERDVATEAQLTKRRAALTDRLLHIRAERVPLEVHREAMLRARTALIEADERRAAFSRAFESSSRPPEYLAVYGAAGGPADVDVRAGFRSLRGRLPFPIAGRAEVHRVHRPHAGGPGLELHAPAGAGVRNVAAGRVVFADRYDEYGLTVIVDHGEHYYSIYGGLGSADVHVGETVASGSRIGAVGTETQKPAMVYYELRKAADTLDPGPWFGLS